jgi:hypothetical protein
MSFIGPRLVNNLSQREETPTQFRKFMDQGDLRASNYDMLPSLPSAPKRGGDQTRNQQEHLSAIKTLFESLPSLGTWEELIAPKNKKFPLEFKTSMQKD